MTIKLRKKLIRIAVALSAFLILFITDHLYPNTPYLLIASLILFVYAGYDVIIKAWKNLRNLNPLDENFLMIVAAIGGFYIGEYLEACAVIIFYQIGEWFQDFAVNRSRNAIKSLVDIAPNITTRIDGDDLEEIDVDEIAIDDLLLVKQGQKIPVDSIVIEGNANLDTSSLTGESLPQYVKEGDKILSGCINTDGILKVKALKTFENSTVYKIIEVIQNAPDVKSKTENFITRFANVYTPIVVSLAVLIVVIPVVFFKQDFNSYMFRACSFLVISCPCALVISIPLSYFGGIGAGSRNNILVKGSSFLDRLNDIRIIATDKTGTLTNASFKIREVMTYDLDESAALSYMKLSEKFSDHPIAKAINSLDIKEAEEEIIEHQDIKGRGVITTTRDHRIILGNKELLEQQGVECKPCDSPYLALYLALDGKHVATITLEDEVKEEAKVLSLLGKKTIMLTGDDKQVAKDVADKLGIDEYHAKLLPLEKEALVEKLKKQGPTLYLGDGINDAPCLVKADIGVSMGQIGSDLAIEAADIIIGDDNLNKLPLMFKIARKTKTIAWENIIFSISVKILILIMAAFGHASMWLAIFADVGVAIIAIINASRTLSIK
ncbi:MAG: cadmium-translocating P-type ATPase [Erysipelotrichaceae bacterium]|nr:cadmium-translocating P-type ATPase [Erysipelotrichaceae bacterium]